MFLRVVDGDGRRQPRPLRVEELVGHLEARGQARGEALLVLGGAQPEVDLQLGLDHPPAGAEPAPAGQLEVKKGGKFELGRLSEEGPLGYVRSDILGEEECLV